MSKTVSRCGVLLVIVLVALVGSCGYRPLLSTERAVDAIHVPMAQNLTSFKDVSAPLTRMLLDELRAAGVQIIGTPRHSWRADVIVVAIDQGTDALRLEATRELPLHLSWQITAMVTIIDPAGVRRVDSLRVVQSAGSPVPGDVSRELAMGEATRRDILHQLAQKIALVIFEMQPSP